MQEENQLATVAADPPQPSTSTSVENDAAQPEGGEHQEQQQTIEQPQQIASDDSTPEQQSRARDQGWRPKGEWRGDPDSWLPAKEFLRRGEQVLPIVRSRAQRAEAEVATLRNQIDERSRDFEERLRRLDRVSQVALQNQAQQIGQYYQGLMRQAVERGDVDGWDNLNRQYAAEIGNLQTRTAEAYQQPAAQTEQPRIDPEADRVVRTWIGQQDWWQRDQNMTAAAVNYHGFLLQSKPWLTLEENLAATERFLDREFPDKRGARAPANGSGQRQSPQQAPAHAPAMEAGTRQPAGAGRTKGWNDLPPEAKKAAERFMSPEHAGGPLYTNDTKGRAEFAADYWSQE